jgi:hypothetical protein
VLTIWYNAKWKQSTNTDKHTHRQTHTCDFGSTTYKPVEHKYQKFSDRSRGIRCCCKTGCASELCTHIITDLLWEKATTGPLEVGHDCNWWASSIHTSEYRMTDLWQRTLHTKNTVNTPILRKAQSLIFPHNWIKDLMGIQAAGCPLSRFGLHWWLFSYPYSFYFSAI